MACRQTAPAVGPGGGERFGEQVAAGTGFADEWASAVARAPASASSQRRAVHAVPGFGQVQRLVGPLLFLRRLLRGLFGSAWEAQISAAAANSFGGSSAGRALPGRCPGPRPRSHRLLVVIVDHAAWSAPARRFESLQGAGRWREGPSDVDPSGWPAVFSHAPSGAHRPTPSVAVDRGTSGPVRPR